MKTAEFIMWSAFVAAGVLAAARYLHPATVSPHALAGMLALGVICGVFWLRRL